MSLGDLYVHSVNHNRPRLQKVLSSEIPIAPVNVRLDRDLSPSVPSSRSEPETVILWAPPYPRHPTPQYSGETLSEPMDYRSVGINDSASISTTPITAQAEPEQVWRHDHISGIEYAPIRKMEASSDERMEDDDDELEPPPTPNTNDTPYIRYALDQLSKPLPSLPATDSSSRTSSTFYPVHRLIPDQGLGYVSHTREELALARKHRSSPDEARLFNFNATRPLSHHDKRQQAQKSNKVNTITGSEVFIAVDPPILSPRYSDLTFKPTILRPLALIVMIILCLLMITALIFCAIYSNRHNGLVAWSGGIDGGLYFVFGFLPQLMAACVYVYVQCVVSAITRIMPYTIMAMDDMEQRTDALFLGIMPECIMIPRFGRPYSIGMAKLFYWLAIFTIPLQSCLFSVKQHDGIWRWRTVQGVLWTLVAVYIFLIIATVMVLLFFRQRMTGLMWDPRSLADIISLLPRSNCLKDYPGTDTMATKQQIRQRIRMRSDRLGYWRTSMPSQGIFYCLGEERATVRQFPKVSGSPELETYRATIYHSADVEKGDFQHASILRRYIPWYLRDTYVVFWAVAAFVFFVALIAISFLPSTAIRQGFPPLLSPISDDEGFAPANFLYSFIPSILGMLLYLMFQSLDMTIRQLQPWAELQDLEGATAERSLLLDYTAALPVECTLSALNRRHYRVAVLSMLSFLFILLPVLGGGLFFPLTTPLDGVRMIPNLASFYTILVLLVFFFLGLLLLIPNRGIMHLPHATECLAEVISFLYGSSFLDNGAFRTARSKADLVTKLLAVRHTGHPTRYGFGTFQGRLGQRCVGIEKMTRIGAHEVMVFDGR